MNATQGIEDLLLLVIAALLPALVYLAWIRTSERYQQEPWGTILGLFAYGAIVATIVAAFLELILVDLGTAASQAYPAPEFAFLNGNSTAGAFFLVLVIAPFVEEGLKAAGVVRYSSRLRGVADGPVFGASAGLGFGFFETFLYGLGAYLTGGLAAGLALIFLRSISSVLLHGSSTAMFGYGYARQKLGQDGSGSGKYYLLAVAMHSSYNFLASLGAFASALGYPGQIGAYATYLGFALAVIFSISAINHVVNVIHASSFPSAGAGSGRYRPPQVKRAPPSG